MSERPLSKIKILGQTYEIASGLDMSTLTEKEVLDGTELVPIENSDGTLQKARLRDNRELVRINVTPATSDLYGATIKVTDITKNEVKLEDTWQGQELSCYVDAYSEYTVEASEIDGYVTEAKTYTAMINGNRAVNVIYGKVDVIYIDQTITDPASMITGDINGEVVQWIRNNSHRVLLRNNGTYCKLLDANSNYYHDNTSADLTGAEGNVMMKLPVFYYEIKKVATDKFSLSISKDVAKIGWNKWEGDKTCLGVYKAYKKANYNPLYSVSGVTPSTEISQTNFKSYAKNRGEEFSIITYEWHCIMAFLYCCKYGNTNSQLKVGKGTSSKKTTGATNSLGMTDTVGDGGNGDSQSINFWGLENFWGDIYEWIDNVNVQDRVWSLAKMSNSEIKTIGTSPSNDGWISKLLLGSNFDMIPTAIEGTATTGYCDFMYQGSGNKALIRAGNTNETNGGVYFISAVYEPSYSSNIYGSRLCYYGNLKEESDVETFKGGGVA